MDFFVLFQICNYHHLNFFTFIIVASGCLCCFMSLCLSYVCLHVIVCVYLYNDDIIMFIDELQIV